MRAGTEEEDGVGEAARDVAEPEARAIGRRLAAYLADQDGEAIDYLIEHAQTVRALMTEDRFAGFERAVHNFDFPAALAALNLCLGKDDHGQ